jgi:hypothetical protein
MEAIIWNTECKQYKISFSPETSKSPQNASNTELYSSRMFNKGKHGAYLKSRYLEPQTKATVNNQQII